MKKVILIVDAASTVTLLGYLDLNFKNTRLEKFREFEMHDSSYFASLNQPVPLPQEIFKRNVHGDSGLNPKKIPLSLLL